jgi:hypothetical protein
MLFEGLEIDEETDLSQSIIDNALLVRHIKKFTNNISKEIENENDLVDRLKRKDFDKTTIDSYLQIYKNQKRS